MKRSIITVMWAVGAAMFLGACSQEISHTESDKHGWFGEQKHEETSVYKNPDGTLSTEHQETRVK